LAFREANLDPRRIKPKEEDKWGTKEEHRTHKENEKRAIKEGHTMHMEEDRIIPMPTVCG
jgi:hypothetical protein